MIRPLREAAIDAGWRAYRERVPGAELAYRKACEGWTVEAVCAGDEVIGALFSKEGVIHIGIVPEWRGRWASRRVMQEILRRGEATYLMDGEPCEDFVRRFGFKKGTYDELRRRHLWVAAAS